MIESRAGIAPEPTAHDGREGDLPARLIGAPDEPVWQSDIAVEAAPEHVLDALTDVEAVAAWSPVGFDVEDHHLNRLQSGTKVQVSGNLVGQRMRFEVEIFQATPERLALRATGPVEMLADYAVRPEARGSRVDAAIRVTPAPGLRGAAIGRAAAILLATGALQHALVRIAREAERRASAQPARRPGLPADPSQRHRRSRRVRRGPASTRRPHITTTGAIR